MPSDTIRQERRAPEAGTILGGKYKLVRVIGEGGMGIVYEGEHIRMGQRVAIKMLLPDTLGQADVVQRFDREARASARLKSRHAARVTDVDHTETGLPYMVMELLQGADLGEVLTERGRLPFQEAVDYVLQACAAIIEAHDLSIIHRDLKPENLFLSRGPEGNIVKLLDFGISKVVDDASRLTSAEAMMGTPLYMSPEQIRSARDVDSRTDVWSLGVILYELLSGDAPFSGTTTQVAAAIVTDEVPATLTSHGVPPELQAVVLRALAKDRNLRIQSARDLAVALLPFVPASSTGAQAIEAALRQSLGPTSISGSMIAPPVHSSGSTLNPTTERRSAAKSTTSRVLLGLVVGVAGLLAAGVVAIVVLTSRGGARPSPTAIAHDVSASNSLAAVPPASVAPSAGPVDVARPSASHDDVAPVSSPAQSAAALPSSRTQPATRPATRPGASAARPVPSAKTGPAASPPGAPTSDLPNHL